MKKSTIIWLFVLAPFLSLSQGVKANVYDKFLKKQRVETEMLSFTGFTGKDKLSVGYTAIGNSLYLNLSGTGWGTTTIDNGDELMLLFSNDSVLTLKSVALQSFEPGLTQNTYRHQYAISPRQLEAINRYDLAGIRKYSFKTFADLEIPKENSAKLKKLGALFVSELKTANIFKALQQISVKDVLLHIGDSVEFCSKVYKTRYFEESAEGPTLLDVQADFSDPFVNVVILQKDRENFNGPPEKKYLNKEVCISGVLTLRNNVPYLAVYSRDQVKVKSPVELSEIDLFIGDSITVYGTVFTAAYLDDSKSKPTLLNMGAPYPGQPLTLVIEGNERVNFNKPEEEYLHKVLQVSGKIASFKGKAQMVLHTPAQVEVIGETAATAATLMANDTPVGGDMVNTTSQPAKGIGSYHRSMEAPAEFPGGAEGFSYFLEQNLVNPENMNPMEQKQVVATFEIDSQGRCKNIQIEESGGYRFDNEVKRVLLKMPNWAPAVRDGKLVTTVIRQPVTFKAHEQ